MKDPQKDPYRPLREQIYAVKARCSSEAEAQLLRENLAIGQAVVQGIVDADIVSTNYPGMSQQEVSEAGRKVRIPQLADEVFSGEQKIDRMSQSFYLLPESIKERLPRGQEKSNLERILNVAEVATEEKGGNCIHKAFVAFKKLHEQGVKPISIYYYDAPNDPHNRDGHFFVVIGDTNRDPRNPSNTAVVVDPWAQMTFPAQNLARAEELDRAGTPDGVYFGDLHHYFSVTPEQRYYQSCTTDVAHPTRDQHSERYLKAPAKPQEPIQPKRTWLETVSKDERAKVQQEVAAWLEAEEASAGEAAEKKEEPPKKRPCKEPAKHTDRINPLERLSQGLPPFGGSGLW